MQLVELFEQDLGYKAAANHIAVGRDPVRRLCRRWLLHGRLCLVDKPTKQQYSFEVKKEVVNRFLSGETRMDLAKEFDLSSAQLVKDWVVKWRKNGDDALRPQPKGHPQGSAKPAPLTEEDTLRREVEKLRAENAGLEEPAAKLKTEAIVFLKSDYKLGDLLEAAGLARSTFFYHQARLDQPDKYAELKQVINTIFKAMKQRYGYHRVHMQPWKQGWKVDHKLVYKLMYQMGIRSKVRARKKYNSHKDQTSHIANNVLDRNFTPDKPNMVWVSDVTEFRVAGTKVYLSPIMDLHDRTILAHELSTSPSTKFTSASLTNEIAWHQPSEGLMVRTDQGFQYQHVSWRRLIESVGGIQSMSRKGNCYDNAVMENFFGHLKAEMYHGECFILPASLDATATPTES